jgi:predicted negative regulator of RcsB-dependent stress response
MVEMIPTPDVGAESEAGGAAKAKAFLARYRREIAVAVAVLVVGFGLYAYIAHSHAVAERAAWSAIYEKTFRASTGGGELGQWLEPVYEEHRGADALFYAYFLEMTSAYDAGDVDGAIAAGQGFLKRYPDHAFAPQVRLDTAKALLRKGEVGEARHLLDAAAKAERPTLEPEIRLARAEALHRAGDLQAARDAYLDISRMGEGRWPAAITSTASFGLLAVEEALRAERDAPLPAWLTRPVSEISSLSGEAGATPPAAAPEEGAPSPDAEAAPEAGSGNVKPNAAATAKTKRETPAKPSASESRTPPETPKAAKPDAKAAPAKKTKPAAKKDAAAGTKADAEAKPETR